MPSEPIIRALGASMSFEDGERAVIGTINTATVDRYSTVILPEGGKLDAYRRNPVVLLNHDPGCIVGRNLWIKLAKGNPSRMVAKTQFRPAEDSPEAEDCYRCYRDGFMQGFSVSILPTSYGLPTADELRKNPDWAEARCIYREWELLEYSCVTVPANAEAVAEAVSRGFLLPEWAEKSREREAPPPEPEVMPTPALPPLVGRTLAQVGAALSRRIEVEVASSRRQAVRDAIDLARGRI